MPSCKNGRWHADACRCLKFWTGKACDKRLCARGAGVLRPDDGLCRCRPGFGGEFCQYEICWHNKEWYCNTTEMAPPTIWDADKAEMAKIEPCSQEILDNWFSTPQSITPTWYCNCGAGYRGSLNGTDILENLCTCNGGYFGEFCETDICSANGSIWNSENSTCVMPGKPSDYETGLFGYEINNELTAATIAVFTLIALFLIIGRWYVRKLDHEEKKLEENDTVSRRNWRKIFIDSEPSPRWSCIDQPPRDRKRRHRTLLPAHFAREMRLPKWQQLKLLTQFSRNSHVCPTSGYASTLRKLVKGKSKTQLIYLLTLPLKIFCQIFNELLFPFWQVAQRMERRKYRVKSKDGTGFGSRHYSHHGQFYATVSTESTTSPKTLFRPHVPAKRKQGNLTPLTPPVGQFDYKAFYTAGPPYMHRQNSGPNKGADAKLIPLFQKSIPEWSLIEWIQKCYELF